MESRIAEEEAAGLAGVEPGEHVGEGRLRCFGGRWGEEKRSELGCERPTSFNREVVKVGVGKMVGSFCFSGRSRSEEGCRRRASAGQGEFGEFEGGGGNGGDLLPAGDLFGGEIHRSRKALVGQIGSELVSEKR